MKGLATAAAVAGVTLISTSAFAQRSSYESMAASHAAANGVPLSLVHRVIMRESRYNPRAVSKGNYGIMQIRLGTARGMGYTGTAAGLLDPNTNMTYAVKYLAGAYKVAGGNESRAVQLYASGYYYAAKRQGMAHLTSARPRTQDVATYSMFEQPAPQVQRVRYSRRAVAKQQQQQQVAVLNPFASLFTPQQPVRKVRHHRRHYQ
jgi:soluble lytic murein transglycosylase-like protein